MENIRKDCDKEVQEKLAYVLKKFRIGGDLIIWRLIVSGHINTTYYCALYDGKEVRQYLAQKVNWYVFREPVSMMHNIDLITQHIRSKMPNCERRRRLHFHHTDEGHNYLMIGEGEAMEFWRVTNYVEHCVSFETSDGNADVLRMSGIAFGRFEKQLNDFDATQLVESIPDFHNTRKRLAQFSADVAADECDRVKTCREEIALIEANKEFGSTLCKLIDAGEVPIRVTHNDAKTNNVLFDKSTLDPLVIIDLDTCMPGLAAYDFGDTIRFAASTAAEDEPDVSKIKLDLRLFRAFTEGYISETAEFLTDKELETMALGCAIITLELASRFLDDYLTGDKYFRIDFPDHNLVRARSQLALFKDMMAHLEDMDRIVHEVAGK